MKVRSVVHRRGRWVVVESEHEYLETALAEFLKQSLNANVEAVALVEDKGDDAPARGGYKAASFEELATWLNTVDDEERGNDDSPTR